MPHYLAHFSNLAMSLRQKYRMVDMYVYKQHPSRVIQKLLKYETWSPNFSLFEFYLGPFPIMKNYQILPLIHIQTPLSI